MSRNAKKNSSLYGSSYSYTKDAEEGQRYSPNRHSNYSKYLCHYNNAVYMGGMSSYKKHGKGFLMHDDGSVAVTQYSYDSPTGHNIIFRQNSITSLLFRNIEQYEIVYKFHKYILKLPFTSNNPQANGIGILIDYNISQIYQLHFKKGVLLKKILCLDKYKNRQVFQDDNIANVIGLRHHQAFSLQFERPSNMDISLDNNIVTIGYLNAKKELSGLAFKFYADNLQVSGSNSLYLKPLEKGYYQHSQLHTFGEKYFSNGNKYIGEFQGDQFQGYGLLLCHKELKWVYGRFSNGQLKDIIDSNKKNNSQSQFSKWSMKLKQIHQKLYRDRWIDFDIELPSQQYLRVVLKEAADKYIADVQKDLYQSSRQNAIRMSRIQQMFVGGNPKDLHQSQQTHQQPKIYSNKPLQGHILTKSRTNKINLSQYDQSLEQRLQTSNLRENQMRIEDPFQIHLFKVEQEYSPQRQGTKSIQKRFSPREIRQVQKDKYHDRYYQKDRYNDSYKQSRKHDYSYGQPYGQSIEGIYRKTYRTELERQSQRLSRVALADSFYIETLRNNLSKSPVLSRYQNSPPKYASPKQYPGDVSKRYFNYQQLPYRDINLFQSRHQDISANLWNDKEIIKPKSPPKYQSNQFVKSPSYTYNSRSPNFIHNNLYN